MVGDYRAGLTADRAADDADAAAGRRIACPTLFCWSTRDDLEDLYGDPLTIWKRWAGDVTGRPIDSGHHMAEENPVALTEALRSLMRR
jgi:haloacetate dehalogenase